jgi:hypothetical protein
MEYGEGVLRINKATDYLIRAARFCKTKWGLTDDAIKVALMRALYAETRHDDKPISTNKLGTLPSTLVVREKKKAD